MTWTTLPARTAWRFITGRPSMHDCTGLTAKLIGIGSQKPMLNFHDHQEIVAIMRFGLKGHVVFLSQRAEASKGLGFHGIFAARAAIISEQIVP